VQDCFELGFDFYDFFVRQLHAVGNSVKKPP